MTRFQAFWSRLHRVGFVDLTTFEVEAADSLTPARRYIGTLRLEGWSWRVTSVRVVGAGF